MIDIAFHEVLDSTSRECSRLLDGGKRPPFAVCAKMQTAGRGRRGHSWSSLPGNLMMTAVVPASVWVKSEARDSSSAPIVAAVLLSRFVHRKFGIRPTLKWPNDLLFAGKKFAGILCETSSSSSGFGDLLVGIGLNVQAAPHLSGAEAVQTTCLAEVIGLAAESMPTIDSLARDLTGYLLEHWSSVRDGDLPAAFFEFAVEPGQLLVYAPINDLNQVSHGESSNSLPPVVGSLATIAGINQSGGLVINPSNERASIELTSASHGWRWIHQLRDFSDDRWPIVVADIGNSRVKLGVFTSAGTVKDFAFPVSGDTDVIAILNDIRKLTGSSDTRLTCHVISVSESNYESFARSAERAGIDLVAVPKRPVRLRSSYQWNQLGIDRVAAIEGFLGALPTPWRDAPQGLGVIVCAGTATTIDVVDFCGKHFGGVILPGVSTALSALHHEAPGLPDLSALVSGADPCVEPGMATMQAILGGAGAMVTGAVEVVLEAVRRRRSNEVGAAVRNDFLVRGMVTGGAGEFVVGALKAARVTHDDLLYMPDLVLRGIRTMVVGG